MTCLPARPAVWIALVLSGTICAAPADQARVAFGADDAKSAKAPNHATKADRPVDQVAPAVPKFAQDVQVRVGNDLRPLAEVVRESSSDAKLALYRQLRKEHGALAHGQLLLAKWCRKEGLTDEARLHWWTLLSMRPDDREAIKALRLRKYQGLLLTQEEIAQAKQEQKKAKQAAAEWMPKLKRIQQAIEHGDTAERDAAFQELQTIRDPRALPSIARIFSIDDSSLALRLVETIAKMPEDEAAESLAQLAVRAPDAYVRERAGAALQSYPEHTYVPLLVAALAAPIEMSSRVSVDPSRPVYEWYEGQQYTGRLVKSGMYNKIRLRSKYVPSDIVTWWSPEVRRIAGWTNTGQTPDRLSYDFQVSRDSPDPDAPYEYSGTFESLNHPGTRNRGAKDFRNSVGDLEKKVKEANEATTLLNGRIHAALTKATGVNVMPSRLKGANEHTDVQPRFWWEWWRKQSESNHYFAQGTEVWTQTGPVPIEQVLVGDRVLTRDAANGELTFKLVIAREAQPEIAMRNIEIGSRTILAVPEQPFSVTGVGWRTASELQAGMQLDGLAGPRPIEKVGPTGPVARYGLTVADTSNFFVDRLGILAHDAIR